jgi:hypothetical protein
MEFKIDKYDAEKFLTLDGVNMLVNLRKNLQNHLIGHFNGEEKYKIPCNERMFGMPNLQLESIEEIRHRIKFINHLLGNGEDIIIK